MSTLFDKTGLSEDQVPAEIERLKSALREINDGIFARGAPLGAPLYFRIRNICCDILYPKQKSAK